MNDDIEELEGLHKSNDFAETGEMINHLKVHMEGKLAENRTFEPNSILRNNINPLYKEIKGITLQCAERESQIDVQRADEGHIDVERIAHKAGVAAISTLVIQLVTMGIFKALSKPLGWVIKKGAKVVGTVLPPAMNKFKKVIIELCEKGGKEVLDDGIEKIVSETVEETGEKVAKETVEEVAEESAEKIVDESVEKSVGDGIKYSPINQCDEISREVAETFEGVAAPQNIYDSLGNVIGKLPGGGNQIFIPDIEARWFQ